MLQGKAVAVAPFGMEWSKVQLGEYADLSGVYVHHTKREILYVGNTTKGKWGKLCERLRREFQEKSSGNSALFQLLLGQGIPIYFVFFDFKTIDNLVQSEWIDISLARKSLIFEQVLIATLSPIANIK